MSGAFYIHIADPQFLDPPWPGVRRLGPFDTQTDALAQAGSDLASGAGLALGVWDESASESMSAIDAAALPPVCTPDDITTAASQIEAANALTQTEADAKLQALLPAGVTVAELRTEGIVQ